MNDQTNQIVFGRRNLSKELVALWQFQSRVIGEKMGLSVVWRDLPIDILDGRRALAAIVVGVTRDGFTEEVLQIRPMQEECQRISASKVFLFAWFPEVDLESQRLLLELGFDRILSEAKHIPWAIQRICKIGTRSLSERHPWLAETSR
jgi:hypothetical protein